MSNKSWIFAVAVGIATVTLPAIGGESSVSNDPNFVVPAITAKRQMMAVPKALIATPPPADYSFENGPPPDSGWSEELLSCGSSRIMDPPLDWGGVGAQDGTYAVWLGGYCGAPESNAVEQSVTVPASAQTLHFWTVFYRPDDDDSTPDDFFHVKMGADTVFTRAMTQANDEHPDWTEHVVDVSAYAGQTVTLRFEAVSAGAQTGNVLLDNIRFDDEGGAPPPATSVTPVPTLETLGLGALAALLGVGGWLGMRRRRSL